MSYPTTLAISIPFNAIQYTLYEHLKRVLNPTHEYSPSTHMISGAGAGAVAAAVTTPLDVAKTMLQTRGTSHDPEIRNVRGMSDAFRIIWSRDGFKGFTRGLTPRVLTTVPSSALSWLSYEFFSESLVYVIYFVLLIVSSFPIQQRPQSALTTEKKRWTRNPKMFWVVLMPNTYHRDRSLLYRYTVYLPLLKKSTCSRVPCC